MNATHASSYISHQHTYLLTTPVPYVPRDETASETFPHHINRVSVFVATWNGLPRPTTITTATDTGRSISAGHQHSPNDDPTLLDLFADLIADAEQRTRQTGLGVTASMAATGELIPSGPHRLTLDGIPVPHLGPTRAETERARAHVCQAGRDLGDLAHVCSCPIGRDHLASPLDSRSAQHDCPHRTVVQ